MILLTLGSTSISIAQPEDLPDVCDWNMEILETISINGDHEYMGLFLEGSYVYICDIEILMDDEGGFCIPDLVRNFDTMTPGQGYYVFSTTDLDFEYQVPDDELLLRPVQQGNSGNTDNSIYADLDFSVVRKTGKPYAVLVNATPELLALNPALIEIYDGDLLVGQQIITAENLAILDDQAVVPVVTWQGSPEHDLPGFEAGHAIRLVLRDEAGDVLPVAISPSDAHFGEGPYTILSVDLIDSELPQEFTVHPAYPNPFNPSISVPFSLPENSDVRFRIFNTLGREVFVKEHRYEAGQHRFTFHASADGTHLVSGMYFLQVEAQGQTVTQKIMLLK